MTLRPKSNTIFVAAITAAITIPGALYLTDIEKNILPSYIETSSAIDNPIVAKYGSTVFYKSTVEELNDPNVNSLYDEIYFLRSIEPDVLAKAIIGSIKSGIRNEIKMKHGVPADSDAILFRPGYKTIERNIKGWCEDNYDGPYCDELLEQNFGVLANQYIAYWSESKLEELVKQEYGKNSLELFFDLTDSARIAQEGIGGDSLHSIGPRDAPVQIELISDFNCAYCSDLAKTIVALVREYPDDIRLNYYHYPSDEFGYALSTYSLCAEQNDRFLEFYDYVHSLDTYQEAYSIALNFGLTVEQISTCDDSIEEISRLDNQIEDIELLEPQGTPLFYVNGQEFVGAKTKEFMTNLIREHVSI